MFLQKGTFTNKEHAEEIKTIDSVLLKMFIYSIGLCDIAQILELGGTLFSLHYENTPIQIYWKVYNQIRKIFR